MDVLIAFLAFLVLTVVGVIGLVKPSKVKLKNRWQAATILSALLPVTGFLMVLFPGSPQPPQTPAEIQNAGIGLISVWLFVVALVVVIRFIARRSKLNKGIGISGSAVDHQAFEQSVVDRSANAKLGFMRSVTSSMDSSLKERIVAEIKSMPNIKAVDENAIASAHQVTRGLVQNLTKKARLELLAAYFDDAMTSRTLGKSSAHQYAESIGLDESDFTDSWSKFQKSEARRFLDEILADGQITPAESIDLKRVQKMLQTDFSNRSQEILEAQKMWIVCNAPLEAVEAPLMMKRGEVCFDFDTVGAFEIRTRTKSISYGGPSLRVPIAKGLSFRIGHSRIAQHKEEHQHSFGSGQLCVTNKRLLWSGTNRTFSIPYEKIVDLDPYTDGITIFKDTGKPLSFDYGRKNKVLSALILRVADEHR